MGHGDIDQREPGRDEQDRRREMDAGCDRAEDQRAGDDAKGHLEHHEHGFRDQRRRSAGGGTDADAAKHYLAPATEEAAAFGKDQRVAKDDPQDGDKRGCDKALHQRG